MQLHAKELRVSTQMGFTKILATEIIQAKNFRQNQKEQEEVCYGAGHVAALPRCKHLCHVQGSPAAENTNHILSGASSLPSTTPWAPSNPS